jgi:DNA primase
VSNPPSRLRRDKLPTVDGYFKSIGISLVGRGRWRSAVCPFHRDTRPSLRVLAERGAFRCMACGASGCDVLAFHMRLRKMDFVTAAQALGAWGGRHG